MKGTRNSLLLEGNFGIEKLAAITLGFSHHRASFQVRGGLGGAVCPRGTSSWGKRTCFFARRMKCIWDGLNVCNHISLFLHVSQLYTRNCTFVFLMISSWPSKQTTNLYSHTFQAVKESTAWITICTGATQICWEVHSIKVVLMDVLRLRYVREEGTFFDCSVCMPWAVVLGFIDARNENKQGLWHAMRCVQFLMGSLGSILK